MSKLKKAFKKVAPMIVNPLSGQASLAKGLLGGKQKAAPGSPQVSMEDLLARIQESSGQDYDALLAEAELQRKTQGEGATSRKTQREQMLNEYADLMSARQQELISEDLPGLYEDLNSRGLMRSSALGQAVSKRQQESASELTNMIGQQALSDRSAYLGETASIEDQYNQGRYGALNRKMSVQDFGRSAEASKIVGQALQPQQPATPSAKGGSALQGALGGAAAGATLGPIGALAGAAGGGVLGGKLGSK